MAFVAANLWCAGQHLGIQNEEKEKGGGEQGTILDLLSTAPNTHGIGDIVSGE